MLVLPYTSASLSLCCDQFDRGSKQAKHEPVHLATEDYDIHFASECSLMHYTADRVLTPSVTKLLSKSFIQYVQLIYPIFLSLVASSPVNANPVNHVPTSTATKCHTLAAPTFMQCIKLYTVYSSILSF